MKLTPSAVFTDVKTFFPMLMAILRGKHKMPWATLLWAIICLAYCISPIDILPDMLLPALGITDDGAFILFVLSLLHKDLEAFRNSQNPQEKPVIIDMEEIKK